MPPDLKSPDPDPPNTDGGRPRWLTVLLTALQALLDPIIALAFMVALGEVVLIAKVGHSDFWLHPGVLLALSLIGLLARQALGLCLSSGTRRRWRASY